MYEIVHEYSMEELLEKMKQFASDTETARLARKAILAERARRNESGLPFDVGFSSGLSFALGAFSGVCEERSDKPCTQD